MSISDSELESPWTYCASQSLFPSNSFIDDKVTNVLSITPYILSITSIISRSLLSRTSTSSETGLFTDRVAP